MSDGECPSQEPGGASFTYTGTLTGNDTIAVAQTGNPSLQPNAGCCPNGAGVLTVGATLSVKPAGESSSYFGPGGIIPAGTWTYGSLLMAVSGVGTVQVFPTNAGNGLGSAAPPAGLNLPATTLGALGFGSFSQSNPAITFIVTDGAFGDNAGQFVLSQAAERHGRRQIGRAPAAHVRRLQRDLQSATADPFHEPGLRDDGTVAGGDSEPGCGRSRPAGGRPDGVGWPPVLRAASSHHAAGATDQRLAAAANHRKNASVNMPNRNPAAMGIQQASSTRSARRSSGTRNASSSAIGMR